jgi:hypothetical protein
MLSTARLRERKSGGGSNLIGIQPVTKIDTMDSHEQQPAFR